MPKKTKTGNRFYSVFMCVKEEVKKYCGISLDFTEYIEKMYGWIENLQAIAGEDDREKSWKLL